MQNRIVSKPLANGGSRTATTLVPHHVTLLGDDLYSKEPFCSSVSTMVSTLSFCKSLTRIPSFMNGGLLLAQDVMVHCEQRRRNGPVTGVALDVFVNDVLLQDGKQTLPVNWVEITVVNAKTGAQL